MTEYVYASNGEPMMNESGEISLARAQIVRCRDCRQYDAEHNGCAEFGDVWHDEWAPVEPDGFCAWAERRGDA